MNYRLPRGIRYAGAKGKCAGIIRHIQSLIDVNKGYWEPFVGSGKIIQGVRNCMRYGCDIDEPIITLLQSIQDGWIPPDRVTEKEYRHWMSQRGKIIDPMMGFVGYGCSFAGRYFQGYARSGSTNFAASAKRTLLRQKPFLVGAILMRRDYRETPKFWPGVVYCDPPYRGTKPVGSMPPFNHKTFWKWAVEQSKHSTVLISEYTCPVPGAVILWEKKVSAGIRFGTHGYGGNVGNYRKKVERLYCLNPDIGRRIGLGVL
jgi:DNA adenine methylase